MITNLTNSRRLQAAFRGSLRRIRPGLSLFTLLILFPALALAQSPFDTGFTAMQTLFTGTVAKVASLIAIVIGGYQFAHGEPGAKKVAARAAGGGTRRLLSGAVHKRQQGQARLASGMAFATVD
jgi:type IV secretory pathway VirB2 component (pilin)